jgi:hypothetical protein
MAQFDNYRRQGGGIEFLLDLQVVNVELGETSLMFLVHPTLSEQNMRETVRAVGKVVAGAGR